MYYNRVNTGVDPMEVTMQFLRIRSFVESKIAVLAELTGYTVEFLTGIWKSAVADCDGSEDALNEEWDDFVTITLEEDW